MKMTTDRDNDSFYDSDDELPALDVLLARLPGRIKQQHSPKPVSYPKLKSATFIVLDDDDSSPESQNTDKTDSFFNLSDTACENAIPPLVKGEARRRWQSSPEDAGDDVGAEEDTTSLPQSRLIKSQRFKQHEFDIRSRRTMKKREDIPSRIEPQASIKQPRGLTKQADGTSRKPSSNTSDSALGLPQSHTLTTERSCSSDLEEIAPQHPRSKSPKRNQIRKSGHQPQVPGHEGGRDINRPFSRLGLGHQDGLGEVILRPGAGTPSAPSVPIRSPKKSRQNKMAPPQEDIFAKKAFEEPILDTVEYQESGDEWNEPEIGSKTKPSRSTVPKTPSKKQTKKSFDAKRSQVAMDFLQQLDAQITHGKIGELTESTGGVKIVWSNTLKTTAGRATWKREAVVPKHTGDSAKVDVKQYRHHSSIELSEKVIDDEQRLLNVIAHEFCHLANFMINGITDNPHGKEFKVWAGKCSQMFGSRGIKVTTKHTYEIDFKYVWTCTACGCEYKRHSKSIDPNRHRCGACKALLEQTKPTPRQTPTSQLSGYQVFVKEQMKIVKSENPNSPQKDIMRIIADRWAKAKS
ncbi:SprT-like family domain-containing protein [Trichoderma barbatum]